MARLRSVWHPSLTDRCAPEPPYGGVGTSCSCCSPAAAAAWSRAPASLRPAATVPRTRCSTRACPSRPQRPTRPRCRTHGHRTDPRPMPWSTPGDVDRGRARNSATTAASTRTAAGEPSIAAPVRPPPSAAARASAGAAIRSRTAPARRPRALPSRARHWAPAVEPTSDGCGGVLDCGSCTAPDFCGGGGINACGHPTALDGGVGPCVPQSCTEQNIQCGFAGDGCGSLILCGSCPTTQSCGGGGVPSQCGSGATCVATTCAQLGYECGSASDGCGGLLDCGGCDTTSRCIRGKCRGPALGPDGGPTCVPRTCAQSPASCGPVGDGCGDVIECGVAGLPGPCGCGLTSPGVIRSCSPLTCADQGIECGPGGDGCGNALDCGACLPPQVCGGVGPSKCG